jgi:hypothetical protein
MSHVLQLPFRPKAVHGGARGIAERESIGFAETCIDCMNRPVRIADQRCARQPLADAACRSVLVVYA